MSNGCRSTSRCRAAPSAVKDRSGMPPANAVHWVDIIGGEILITDFATGATPAIRLCRDGRRRRARAARAASSRPCEWLRRPRRRRRRPRTACDILPDGIRMNDAKTDPGGRFWAGSCEMDFAEGIGGLWRLDENWEADARPSDLTHPNGLGWSPDGDRLLPGGDAGAPDPPLRLRPGHEHAHVDATVLVDAEMFPNGLADGLAVDTRGHLWVAEFGGLAVHEFSPSGDRLRTVRVPTQQTTSCTSSGPILDELWVTSAALQTRPRRRRRCRLDLPRRRTRCHRAAHRSVPRLTADSPSLRRVRRARSRPNAVPTSCRSSTARAARPCSRNRPPVVPHE